jgi:DNA-binding MarR family transcriptional regulator
MAWQRSVDRALRPLGLTHTQALVLSAIDAACKRERDALSHVAIAAEAGLDKVTVGAVLRTLDSRGYISRDIAFGDRREWRIYLTAKGERILASAVPLLEEASSVLPRRGR